MSQSFTSSRAPGLRSYTARILVFGLALAALACGGGQETPRVATTPRIDMPASAALGEPLNMTYTWEPAGDFEPPADDYKVFVHFRDPEGRVRYQDDHYPPEPTSQWAAGEPMEYSRWLYPPDDVEVEYIDVVVGLYAEQGGRIEVRDGEEWVEELRAHRLEIATDDMSGIPVYMDGWHPLEEDGSGKEWHWSQGEARAVFTNPRSDAVLHLGAHSPYDELGGPQTVTLEIDGTEIESFEVTDATPFLERIEVPAEVLGDNDWVELTLRVSPTVVPNEVNPDSGDDRELGLQVFSLYMSSP